LPGILIIFELYKVAIREGIKDMFLRIKVREIDREAHMFLRRGKNRDKDPIHFEMMSLIFGSKS
jgi:hypothetical protein